MERFGEGGKKGKELQKWSPGSLSEYHLYGGCWKMFRCKEKRTRSWGM